MGDIDVEADMEAEDEAAVEADDECEEMMRAFVAQRRDWIRCTSTCVVDGNGTMRPWGVDLLGEAHDGTRAISIVMYLEEWNEIENEFCLSTPDSESPF